MPSTSRAANVALAVIVTCQLMVVLDVSVVNIALVPIQRSLHFTPAGLAWVVDAYTLTFGGLLLLGGRAGDVFGRRRMLMIGLAIFTAASALGGFAADSAMLVATRAAQGVGAAMASPSTLSLITATFEEGPARNRALGIFTAVSAAGGSIGLLLGGALTSYLSWRWVLFINVPIGIAVLVLAPRVVPEPTRNGRRIDLAGGVAVTGGLAAIIYAFIRLAEHGSGAVIGGSFALGAALLAGFVVLQRRRADPLLPLRLLTDRVRGSSYLTLLTVPAAMFGVFFFISQFLEADLHDSAIVTGLAFLPTTGLIFASSRVTPRIVSRIGTRPVLLFGLTTFVAAVAWISRATPADGYLAGLFGPLLLLGLGGGCCFLPLSVNILAGVPRDDAGAASGMLQTMQQTGAALGVAALTSIAAAHGRQDALIAATGIAAVGLLVALTLVRAARPHTQPGVPEEPAMALVE